MFPRSNGDAQTAASAGGLDLAPTGINRTAAGINVTMNRLPKASPPPKKFQFETFRSPRLVREITSGENMSKMNGDKARFHKLRKKNIARRTKARELRQTMLVAKTVVPTVPE